MTRNTPLRRPAVVALAAGTALVLAAGPASAAITVTPSGSAGARTVTVTGDAADDSAVVACTGGDVAVSTNTTTEPCNGVTSFVLTTLAGDDLVNATAATSPPFAAGVTTTVNAGPGQDQVFGGTAVDGGDGNDRFINGLVGPTSIIGGEGTDSVEYDFTTTTTASSTAVSFTVGASGFNATGTTPTAVTVTGVEQYVFSTPDGSAAADVSTIDARTSGARVVARMHSGVDTFYGGSGNDYVDAGPGRDVIDPGGGNDSVQGGEGADVINVRDGAVDVVDCGDDLNAVDTVTADREDVLKGCESVNLPPLPPPAPTPAPETSAVVGTKQIVRGGKASFAFVSPSAGARFECRLDQRGWTGCRSPYKLKTKNLRVGKHTLLVRAVLAGGNVDASPSRTTFKVTKAPKKKRR